MLKNGKNFQERKFVLKFEQNVKKWNENFSDFMRKNSFFWKNLAI